MRVGRNDTCPCGSGKKFKVCCDGKNQRGMSRGLILLFVAIGALAAVGLIASIRDEPKPAPLPAPTASTANTASTPRQKPGGTAPAGKVWSEEHGHWHDQAQTTRSQPIQISPGALAPAPTPTPTPKPQPPGPVPAGKVWSPTHGHWHDAR